MFDSGRIQPIPEYLDISNAYIFFYYFIFNFKKIIEVELVLFEDLRMIDSGHSTIVRAGQRVRLT